MRVTERGRATLQMAQLRQTSAALARTTDSISSGRRIDRDSQDPPSAGAARRARAVVARREGFLEANRNADQQMQTTEQLIALAENVLIRATELGVQGANGSLSDAQRALIATEAAGLRRSLVDLVNSREREAFLFGGQREAVPPVDAAGVYQGSGPARVVPIEADTALPLPTAEEAFGVPGNSAFDALDNLINALATGSPQDVSAQLGDVRASLGRLSDARAQIGSRQQVAEQARAFDESLILASRRAGSEAEDTDYLVAIPMLSRQQQALEAALRVQRIASDATRSLFR